MLNREFAFLYGTLMGDGCLSNYKRKYIISITCNVHDDEPFFIKKIIPILNKLRNVPNKYRKRVDQGKIEISFSDKLLFNKIKKLGFPIGKKGDKLTIPNIFIKSKLVKYIISGIFSTDGSLFLAKNNGIKYPRLELESCSSKLLNQISKVLSDMKINNRVYRLNKRTGLIFRLDVNGRFNILKFDEKIGFANPKQKEKFDEIFDSNSSV